MVVEPWFFGVMDFRYNETLNKVRINYVLKN